MPTGEFYIHPDATSSVVPLLKAHLPHASVQLYLVEVPPTPDSTVLATFPPSESPPESRAWAIGVLGITAMPQTEFWFWSSVEGSPSTNCDEDGEEERFRMAYTQYEQMLKFIGCMYPEKETLMATITLHGPRSFFPKISYHHWIPVPSILDQHTPSKGSQWKTSTLPRVKTTLSAASNTGAYLASSEEKGAQAWCFMSREGSISTVYVRLESRGIGLGKETVMKELEKAFVHRKFVIAHISPTNSASLRLCQSLGACGLACR